MRSTYKTLKQETVRSFAHFAQGGSTPDWPSELFLELSNVCDLKCAMCQEFSSLNPLRYFNLRQENRGFMQAGDYLESLETVLKHSLFVHAFGYGEPTIHPQFSDFLETIAPYEVMIDFFTNGMHLTDELCETLVSNHVSKITVSFSGSTKSDYENVYLGGVFETVLEGIDRLTAYKRSSNSPYPRIDVNSIGFKHHIETLPEFVDLMGDHGVEVIHVKALNAFETIQPLHEHISIFKPWEEGKILEEAKRRAKERGIILASLPYERTAITRADDEAAQRKARIVSARYTPKNGMPELGTRIGDDESQAQAVPISAFKELAKSIKPISFTGDDAAVDSSIRYAPHDGSDYEMLDIRDPKTAMPEPCMEPFKTMYIRRDGATEPCALGLKKATFGNIDLASGEEIWDGESYSNVRQGVIDGNYPMATCERCIALGNAPIHHASLQKYNEYSRWYKAVYGDEFFPEIEGEIKSLQKNSEIVAIHSEKKQGSAGRSGV